MSGLYARYMFIKQKPDIYRCICFSHDRFLCRYPDYKYISLCMLFCKRKTSNSQLNTSYLCSRKDTPFYQLFFFFSLSFIYGNGLTRNVAPTKVMRERGRIDQLANINRVMTFNFFPFIQGVAVRISPVCEVLSSKTQQNLNRNFSNPLLKGTRLVWRPKLDTKNLVLLQVEHWMSLSYPFLTIF